MSFLERVRELFSRPKPDDGRSTVKRRKRHSLGSASSLLRASFGVRGQQRSLEATPTDDWRAFGDGYGESLAAEIESSRQRPKGRKGKGKEGEGKERRRREECSSSSLGSRRCSLGLEKAASPKAAAAVWSPSKDPCNKVHEMHCREMKQPHVTQGPGKCQSRKNVLTRRPRKLKMLPFLAFGLELIRVYLCDCVPSCSPSAFCLRIL